MKEWLVCMSRKVLMKRLLGKGWKKVEGRGRELRLGYKFLGNVYGVFICVMFVIMMFVVGYCIGCLFV